MEVASSDFRTQLTFSLKYSHFRKSLLSFQHCIQSTMTAKNLFWIASVEWLFNLWLFSKSMIPRRYSISCIERAQSKESTYLNALIVQIVYENFSFSFFSSVAVSMPTKLMKKKQKMHENNKQFGNSLVILRMSAEQFRFGERSRAIWCSAQVSRPRHKLDLMHEREALFGRHSAHRSNVKCVVTYLWRWCRWPGTITSMSASLSVSIFKATSYINSSV